MEFKGTKGKWSIDYLGKEPISVATDLPISGNVICVPPDEFLPGSLENWHSNAILISKAPEMLEMLKELLSHYEDVVKGDYSPFALRSTIDKAKQLIKESTELK